MLGEGGTVGDATAVEDAEVRETEAPAPAALVDVGVRERVTGVVEDVPDAKRFVGVTDRWAVELLAAAPILDEATGGGVGAEPLPSRLRRIVSVAPAVVGVADS